MPATKLVVRTVVAAGRKTLPRHTRRALRRRLPGWAWYRVERANSYLRGPLDPAPLARIGTEPLERLQDEECLVELLPAMGLTSLNPALFPSELAVHLGSGVQSIQFPIQLAPYLAKLTTANVRSYLEVGVEHGGTFAITVEVLRRFGLERALAVDLGPTPLLFRRWKRPGVGFAAVDSHTPAFERVLARHGPFDLAMIDGDHSEEGVRADLEAVLPRARMIALHDIVEPVWPGVGRVWASLRSQHADEYCFHEFIAQYPGQVTPRLGIGLAIRR